MTCDVLAISCFVYAIIFYIANVGCSPFKQEKIFAQSLEELKLIIDDTSPKSSEEILEEDEKINDLNYTDYEF